jgi:hypothetical protein
VAEAAPVATPDLVEAEPGVQVVADYDTPVFFHAGLYWHHDNGGWSSSRTYTGGWAHAASPPAEIVKIDRPERFVHYKPSGYVARNRPAPQAEVRADVRVEPPRADVRVEPPRAEVRVDGAHANVRVEPPRAEVHVQTPRVEVRPPQVVVKPNPRDHRDDR